MIRVIIATLLALAMALVSPAVQAGGSVKKLVVVFQRGGNDGINTLIPIEGDEYADYIAARPTLAVAEAEIIPHPATTFFGIHPAMASLLPVIQSGDMSFVHAVAYPGFDLSKNLSQLHWETAVPGNSFLGGWLNRYLTFTTGPGTTRSVHVGDLLPRSQRGSISVASANNFGATYAQLTVDPGASAGLASNFLTALADIYNLAPPSGQEHLYADGLAVLQAIDSLGNRDLSSYIPENGAAYPPTLFGDKMKHAAQLLKDDLFLGIEIITIDQPGYDTMVQQASTHAALLQDLADSLSAFYADMGPVRMDDAGVLVISESGRNIVENGNSGTDRGTAGLVMFMANAANGTVRGGGLEWPGLSPDANGGLNWNTDFRDVYWEIMATHMGVDNVDLGLIIPGHLYSPLGIVD